ncbi:hypothetical protein IE077_004114 [Cardiosporidium cionae]|uniref:Uncharacterized protein n=1 Tax=Cardiosporidium cionae TaxID=476202 RepID=A0ABQ7JE39_9APIC|nr:hypothetical protein IE077_004114 [Cardiosporidium cionae]|eukprot:KAF8822275.1 hypothetical protein IE077_004114 [Cardiosporidium cionae]
MNTASMERSWILKLLQRSVSHFSTGFVSSHERAMGESLYPMGLGSAEVLYLPSHSLLWEAMNRRHVFPSLLAFCEELPCEMSDRLDILRILRNATTVPKEWLESDAEQDTCVEDPLGGWNPPFSIFIASQLIENFGFLQWIQLQVISILSSIRKISNRGKGDNAAFPVEFDRNRSIVHLLHSAKPTRAPIQRISIRKGESISTALPTSLLYPFDTSTPTEKYASSSLIHTTSAFSSILNGLMCLTHCLENTMTATMLPPFSRVVNSREISLLKRLHLSTFQQTLEPCLSLDSPTFSLSENGIGSAIVSVRRTAAILERCLGAYLRDAAATGSTLDISVIEHQHSVNNTSVYSPKDAESTDKLPLLYKKCPQITPEIGKSNLEEENALPLFSWIALRCTLRPLHQLPSKSIMQQFSHRRRFLALSSLQNGERFLAFSHSEDASRLDSSDKQSLLAEGDRTVEKKIKSSKMDASSSCSTAQEQATSSGHRSNRQESLSTQRVQSCFGFDSRALSLVIPFLECIQTCVRGWFYLFVNYIGDCMLQILLVHLEDSCLKKDIFSTYSNELHTFLETFHVQRRNVHSVWKQCIEALQNLFSTLWQLCWGVGNLLSSSTEFRMSSKRKFDASSLYSNVSADKHVDTQMNSYFTCMETIFLAAKSKKNYPAAHISTLHTICTHVVLCMDDILSFAEILAVFDDILLHPFGGMGDSIYEKKDMTTPSAGESHFNFLFQPIETEQVEVLHLEKGRRQNDPYSSIDFPSNFRTFSLKDCGQDHAINDGRNIPGLSKFSNDPHRFALAAKVVQILFPHTEAYPPYLYPPKAKAAIASVDTTSFPHVVSNERISNPPQESIQYGELTRNVARMTVFLMFCQIHSLHEAGSRIAKGSDKFLYQATSHPRICTYICFMQYSRWHTFEDLEKQSLQNILFDFFISQDFSYLDGTTEKNRLP